MRIVLNVSSELVEMLVAAAIKGKKSINQMLIDDIETKYLQSISNDTALLNKLISDAKKYAQKNPVCTRFTVSNLPAIQAAALQDEMAGKRSAQRASVTRRLIRAIKDGSVPNVCCLLDSNRDAVKIERNSAFVVVKPETYQALTSDKTITKESLTSEKVFTEEIINEKEPN